MRVHYMAEANAQPSNALIILAELDGRLNAPIRLVLFGRGALALGFEPPLPKWAQTLDLARPRLRPASGIRQFDSAGRGAAGFGGLANGGTEF